MDAKIQIAEGRQPVLAAVDLPENGRIFMVCMQCQTDGQWRGRIHNLYVEQPQAFVGLAEAVLKMDGMMDALDNPQAVTKHRSFWQPAKGNSHNAVVQQAARKTIRQYWTEASLHTTQEDGAVFFIRVRFRQHSSWQGEVTWKQENKTVAFRSVLELLHLLQSAMERQQAGKAVKAGKEKQP